jgi:hypothetical protein
MEVVFSTFFDLCADQNGLRELPSGTTPHNPAETRFVFRNAEVVSRFDRAISDRVAQLSREHDSAGLLALLRSELRPVGRAAESNWV